MSFEPYESTALQVNRRETNRVGLTDRRETDTHGALVKGLADYLRGLTGEDTGKELRFVEVVEDMPDWEVEDTYPAASVYSDEQGTYGTGDDDTELDAGEPVQVAGTNIMLQVRAEYILPITVEVWATNHQERTALCMLLENAFAPVEWMTGFRLYLPHYYHALATYELVANMYSNEEVESARRNIKAVFALLGRVDWMTRLGERPLFTPRVDVAARPR